MQYCMHSYQQSPESDVLLYYYLVDLKYLNKFFPSTYTVWK